MSIGPPPGFENMGDPFTMSGQLPSQDLYDTMPIEGGLGISGGDMYDPLAMNDPDLDYER